MKQYFTIGGHAWKRRFFHTVEGKYHAYDIPGGGAMLAALLGRGAAPVALPAKGTCEHICLDQAVGKHGVRYVAGIHAGWTEGSAAAQAGQTAQTGKTGKAGLAGQTGKREPNACVIWDEGFGGICVPDGLPVLWASNRALPDKTATEAIQGRCFLLLDVNVLREKGAMISRQVSWERSATDLVWQLSNNPSINYLNRFDHILITFAEDGAVYLSREAGGEPREAASGETREAGGEAASRDPQEAASGKGRRSSPLIPQLVLSDGGAEGSMRDRCGAVPDSWAMMVHNTALQFVDALAGTKAFCSDSVLASARSLLGAGYDPIVLEGGDFREWLDFEDGDGDAGRHVYRVPVFDANLGADPHYWSIGAEAQGGKVFDMAFDCVKHGPGAVKGLPQLSFGALTTIDRKEIESFQNVKNLIVEYAEGKTVRPLSIAVFGAPGSGKSFGVTQIAKNVLANDKIKKLEFNVSQLTSEEDLAQAFHQVRDCILGGQLPLVFFDEFDSDRDGRPLGWLKNFLMPMQDGTFKDAGGEHPVGKCILVFAGGTSPTFEDFSAALRSGDPAARKAFADVKGPDFVSRLRGTVNVLGPNPVAKSDKNYILRRALLLRSLCEGKLQPARGELPVNDDVIRAMLLAPAYRHGARSMEAILGMSRIGEGMSWEPASLPFYTQLSLHVDADAFIRLVLNKVRLNSFTDKLAKAIHDDFESKQRARGDDGPYVSDWESLPEKVKEDNREQARAIPGKLAAVGCGYDAKDTPFPSVESFSETDTEAGDPGAAVAGSAAAGEAVAGGAEAADAVAEATGAAGAPGADAAAGAEAAKVGGEILTLSIIEHDRWMAGKAALGYVYGSVRNDDAGKGQLTHPDMLPWDKLTPASQQKDIDTARNIIPLLAGVDLRVYRIV
jgi:hypothetical protein